MMYQFLVIISVAYLCELVETDLCSNVTWQVLCSLVMFQQSFTKFVITAYYYVLLWWHG